jgi:hypothetical protein
MRHSVHSDVLLYIHGMQLCDDTFPKENMPFYFNYSRDLVVGLRSRNV